MKIRKSTIAMVVSMFFIGATAYFAKVETPVALERKAEKEKEKGEPLTFLEIVKAEAPAYKKTAMAMAVSFAAEIISHQLDTKYIAEVTATLGGAAALATEKYNELKSAVIETVGEEEFTKIQDKIVSENFPDVDFSIYVPKSEERNKLYFDSYTGVFFYSNDIEVYDAMYKLNRNFAMRTMQNVTEWLYLLGITDKELLLNYQRHIWSIDYFYDAGTDPWIDFSNLFNKDCKKKLIGSDEEYTIIYFVQDPEFTMEYDAEDIRANFLETYISDLGL